MVQTCHDAAMLALADSFRLRNLSQPTFSFVILAWQCAVAGHKALRSIDFKSKGIDPLLSISRMPGEEETIAGSKVPSRGIFKSHGDHDQGHLIAACAFLLHLVL